MKYYENGECCARPLWSDVRTVYTRMDARRLLRIRPDPGKIAGRILCLAVFARAARFQAEPFDLEEFIAEYCECKKIDYDDFLQEMRDFYEDLGCWDSNPISMMEALSAT